MPSGVTDHSHDRASEPSSPTASCITAAHVVEGDLRDLRVGDSDAAVVGIDARTDLALVAILGPHRCVPRWIETGQVDAVAGPVQVVSPDGAVDTELVRSLALRVDDISNDTIDERQALELDIVVDEGDSGSPVVDDDGDLLGVVVLRRPSTGVSYASVVPLLDDLFDHALYQDVRARSACPIAAVHLGCPEHGLEPVEISGR